MYAQLCKRLSEEAPNFEPPNSPCTFRLLLLNRCKVEFENRAGALEQHVCGSGNAEEEERRQLAKRKMLGNIKFIGELGKLEILSESILHRCIQELLQTRKGDDPSEDLECLCQIMRTCGRILDSDKGKQLMNQYFERMGTLAENQHLQPRIRFMLKDVIDLRRNRWTPRKATVVEGPVPMCEIKPVEDDRPGGGRGRGGDHRNNADRDDRSGMSELFRHPMPMRGGIDDMLMGISLSPSSANLIPTHPFVSNGYGGGGHRDGGGYRHNNQRSSGYNNFNNQRGQYKHNQNNSNSQYNNNQSKQDIAPRFKKNLIVAREQNISDLELRPGSMLFKASATVKTNNLMNTRPLDPPMPPPPIKTTPTVPVKESLPIKQVSTEKPKQAKKDKGPTKDEVLKKYATLLEELWKEEVDIERAVEKYKEFKVPDKFSKEVMVSGLSKALPKKDEESTKLIHLMAALKKESLLTNTVAQDSFKALCGLLEGQQENETDAASIMFCEAVAENLITLSDLASHTDNGAHHPLFFVILQKLHERHGKSELLELFNKSKVNLLGQLPENEKTKEKLSETLEQRDLTFLYPLLRIQGELAKQLQADPNPQQFYKWIKENLEPVNYTDPGFINALMTVLLKYITQEAAASAGGDDKVAGEKERAMLERYQPLLHAFLHEQPSLQLIAVYSLQVHFYARGFPRGQLLRWFMALYDLEIVEEEAFLNWKEDVTDAYPGKGQALFQVNQWLTWLQEAESEEEEGDD